jgi:REP element-mobilizing transposase RayT
MPRAVRRDIEGGWHHVMNRGADHQRIFFSTSDGEAFEQLLAEGVQRHGVELHAYCLMPNHFHLLLHCPDGGVSTFMQRVGTLYARRVKFRRSGDGPVFRSRFRSIPLRSFEHVAQVGRYIHRNPTDLSPPVDLTTYRWSSLRCYAGVATVPSWLRTTTLPILCSGDYLDFVRDDLAA